MITKPMLAGKCTDVTKLTFPVLATPKLDGIRCLMIDGKAVSRKFKPIPNKHIRSTLERTCNSLQLDGEIMIEGRSFNDLSGDIRREEGKPDFYYAVFDLVRANCEPYEERMKSLAAFHLPACCRKVFPRLLNTVEELQAYEQEQLALGYEGIMVRSPNGPYKCGRSTENEGYLLKIKRFEDDEALVIGYEELMHNDNVATRDAFGRTERSSHQENKRGAGVLGKLICRRLLITTSSKEQTQATKWEDLGTLYGDEFGIGTGYSAKDRADLYAKRDKLKHKIVKFKHQPSGAAERPRFPVFLGFRDEWDL